MNSSSNLAKKQIRDVKAESEPKNASEIISTANSTHEVAADTYGEFGTKN
jgi:hypothetical protein